MSAFLNRREVSKWILSATIGGLADVRLVANSRLFPGSSGNSIHEPNFESIRRRIRLAIERGEATGVAVALVDRGRIAWEEGFGWANREAGLKATPHTPFGMASITKPFTATTMMTLVAGGKLSLDDPANKYLPNGKILSNNGNADEVSVRLLGAHASGLPGIYESYGTEEARLVPTPNAVIQEYGRLAYPPATCYEYSNLGFAALNAIASGLTQRDFGTLMAQKVLEPLGLSDSFFGSDSSRVSSGATRYDPLGHVIPHYTTSTPASGELYASVHDLARFAIFNMGLRDQGQAAILGEQFIDALHRPAFTGPSGVATTFGWFMGHTASGVPFYFKSGGDPGVANRMCFVPSKGLACAVVTNQSNSGELAYSVLDELITNYLPEWRRPEEDCGFPGGPFLATSAFRGQWQGKLENDGASMQIQLNIQSNESATLTIGTNRAEGEAFTGVSTGEIRSPDAIRTGAKTLQLKLIPRNDRLVGRVFALAGDPNFKSARLPYVLTLMRN